MIEERNEKAEHESNSDLLVVMLCSSLFSYLNKGASLSNGTVDGEMRIHSPHLVQVALQRTIAFNRRLNKETNRIDIHGVSVDRIKTKIMQDQVRISHHFKTIKFWI